MGEGDFDGEFFLKSDGKRSTKIARRGGPAGERALVWKLAGKDGGILPVR